MFAILAEAVTVRDPSGELVFANQAALRHLGFESLDHLRERSTESIMDDYLVEDELGRPLAHGDVPSIRLLKGERVEPILMRVVHRATGELQWMLLKTDALRDEDGAVLGAITVIEDVTAVKTAELRTRVLAESGRILGRRSTTRRLSATSRESRCPRWRTTAVSTSSTSAVGWSVSPLPTATPRSVILRMNSVRLSRRR